MRDRSLLAARRSWMSVRTPWLSWRSPEITEVSWFDFELNWRLTFRWKWLIPRQIPRSSARLLRCRGRLILRCEWSYQTQVRRSISFFSFYTLTLKSYCWADPCPHGANESETNYPFWDLDINFMLKQLIILSTLPGVGQINHARLKVTARQYWICHLLSLATKWF